jgi:hypothetical protein
LRHHVERTLPGITNRLQKALSVAEESIIPKGQEVSERGYILSGITGRELLS